MSDRFLVHFIFHHTVFVYFTSSKSYWTMSGRGKGGKGLGKGGAKRHRKVLRDNIQGMFISLQCSQSSLNIRFRYHKTRYPSSCSTRWCQTYFGFDLRRSPWSSENLSWKRYSWCCYIHRTCETKDSHSYGCCLRLETPRSYFVRFRLVNGSNSFIT